MTEARRGLVVSAETRAKISAANKSKHYYSHTPEAIAKIVASLTGRPVSEETRARIGAANRGRKHGDGFGAAISARLLGKRRGPMSVETKTKIGAGNKAAYARRLAADHAAGDTLTTVGTQAPAQRG